MAEIRGDVMECIFPNPRFRKVSDGLYICEDEEVMKQLRAESQEGKQYVSYEELAERVNSNRTTV